MHLLRDVEFWLRVAGIVIPGLIVPYVIYRLITRRMAEYQSRLSKEIEENQTRLNKGLEDHKSAISRELENYKFQLQTSFATKLYQFQTRHSMLHEKKAEAIEKLFGLLARVENDLLILERSKVNALPGTLEELYNKTRNDITNLITFYEEKRIYFDREIEERIFVMLRAAGQLLNGPLSIESLNNSAPLLADFNKNQARQTLAENIHPVMGQLEKIFKKLITVETPGNSLTDSNFKSSNMNKKP
jgi:uncharacterized membrane-anchored protein YhcB (DUF1043 family)